MAKNIRIVGTFEVCSLEQGPQGPQGPRGPMERIRKWEAGASYTAGGAGEDYGDIVYEDGSRVPYECVVSHTAQEGYPPSALANHSDPSMRYWRAGEHRYMVATDIMLSRLIVASEIDVESLVAQKFETSGDAKVRIQNGLMEVFGSANKVEPNIRFGVNEDGYAVLQYFDNSGKFLYDLGPNGLSEIDVREAKWITYRRKFLGTDEATVVRGTAWKNTLYTSGTDVYKYVSKVVAGVNQDPQNDGLYFNVKNTEGEKLNGWYCPVGSNGSGTDNSVGMVPSYEYVRDTSIYQPAVTNKAGHSIYFKNLEYYQNGVLTRIQPVYWAVPTSNTAYPVN